MTEEQGQRKQSSNKQKASEAMQQAINPKQSYWPFALAVALFIALLGVIVHPIVFGAGLVLVAISIIGWGLEHH